MNAGDYADMFRRVLPDAIDRINQADTSEKPITQFLSDVEFFSWPQTWGDTSCGFGGIAGQMMTSAQTIVVYSPLTNAAVVYHSGRFAYIVRDASPEFYSDMGVGRQVAGRRDMKRRREYERAPHNR